MTVDADHVNYEERNEAAVVTIDRPEKLNALNEQALAEIEVALDEAVALDVRVVVIRGNEDAFSAGYDIGGDGVDERELTVADWLERMPVPLLPKIYELELPVIAAVDGYALAGGCNLALVCDLTIATERAQLGYPDVRMGGLPVHFVHPFVMSSIKHARELFYSGKMIDGAEAARMGLVNRAVAHDELMDAVWTEVEGIKKTPAVIVTIAKAMLNDAMERQGFRPRGRLGELAASLSVLSDPAHEFYERRDADGMDEAIEWMHSAEKD